MNAVKQVKYLIIGLILLLTTTLCQASKGEFSYLINQPKEMDCLYQTLYHEARAEPLKGQVAVVQVVLNRVKDSRFPNTPCSVLHQKGQFSFVGKGYTIKETSLYEQNKEVVRGVLAAKYPDYSKGALFFNSSHRSPTKTAKCTIRIGNHSFYK